MRRATLIDGFGHGRILPAAHFGSLRTPFWGPRYDPRGFPVGGAAMTTVRFALFTFLLLAATAAHGGPAATLAETSAKSKETYDGARKELLARGKKAKAAAVAGDFATWKPANEAYMTQIATMTGICEQNVAALTSSSDVPQHETNVVVATYSQYLDVAPSRLKARLQLLAYANLAERFAAADRVAILKALSTQYLSAE